jgi:hypothetical protein
MASRVLGTVGLGDLFGQAGESRGRVVRITSRDRVLLRGEALGLDGAPGSVFTMALLEGLHTGEADADRDGFVSISEAYLYVYAGAGEWRRADSAALGLRR